MLFEYTGECKDPSDFFAMWVNDTKHTINRGDVQFAGISESGMMVDTIQTAIRAAEHRRQNKLGLKQTPVLASYSVAGNGNIVFNNPYLGLHEFEGQSMIASIVAAINQARFSVACCSRQLDPIMYPMSSGHSVYYYPELESDIWIFQASSTAQLAATASALAEMADVQPMDQIACLMFKTQREVRVIAGPLQVQEAVLSTIKSTWPRGIKDRPRKYSSGLVTFPLKAAGMFTADIHDDIQAVRLYLCTLARMAHEGWKLVAKATVGEEVLHYFVPAPRVYEVPAIFSISLTGMQIVESCAPVTRWTIRPSSRAC
ncbi:hypothetical protein BC831DRAFT_296797 [Entophlyctis helioformis]|nr:hypothetical protein BC831DRAFT_296797 [Entophlyctis helioformis]